MTEDSILINEIVESAGKTPLKYQEHILDIVKAMVFTRTVCSKESAGLDEADE